MKRDPRLVELSRDHYRALLLAASIRKAMDATALAALRGEALRAFHDDLAPHFEIEEELLLAPLARLGHGAHPHVLREYDDHAALRAGAGALERGAPLDLAAWGQRLHDHVRFEERVFFPWCEQMLPSDCLDALQARLLARAPVGTPSGSGDVAVSDCE